MRACVNLHYILPDRAGLQDGIVEPSIDGDFSSENLNNNKIFFMAIVHILSVYNWNVIRNTAAIISKLNRSKLYIMHYIPLINQEWGHYREIVIDYVAFLALFLKRIQ